MVPNVSAPSSASTSGQSFYSTLQRTQIADELATRACGRLEG